MNQIKNDEFNSSILELLQNARNQVLQSVNTVMVYTYFEIGRKIVEKEQGGKNRAEYGKNIIESLSEVLIKAFGKGYSVRNLEQMRQFYLVYSSTLISTQEIPQTPSAELGQIVKIASPHFSLSWSHYVFLMRLDDLNERNFYEIESKQNNWSLRELKRQFDTALFHRLVLSSDKNKVKELSLKGQIIEKPKDLIKEPYILEFLGLEQNSKYSESELEQKIIDKLEHFLLELGKGFLFSGRQVRFTFDEEHFFVDLVFYNRLLKCFVLIDLKIGKLKHQDIGQIQMYVNYYDRFVKSDDENKTIGILLCRDKSHGLVEMTLPLDNTQIFASKYLTVLPSKEELKKLIEE